MLDIPPKVKPATGTVMVLHGWGANCHDVELLAEALRIPSLRYVLPEGQYDVPGTAGQGKGWFSLPLDNKSKIERLKSREQIFEILKKLEKENIPASKIALMGFSQGGSMSLDVLLNYGKPVAGAISLSGFLLDSDTIKKRSNLPTGSPIFAGHGTLDPTIPINHGRLSIKTLEEVGFDVEWHEYPADHRVVIEEIEHVRQFLHRLFPQENRKS